MIMSAPQFIGLFILAIVPSQVLSFSSFSFLLRCPRISFWACSEHDKYLDCAKSPRVQSAFRLFSKVSGDKDVVKDLSRAELNMSELTEEDWNLVHDLATLSGAVLDKALFDKLPSLHPRLIMKLHEVNTVENTDSNDLEFEGERIKLLKIVASALMRVMGSNLQSGRKLLAELLDANELRKLDSLIASAAKKGRLDMAFFTVLEMNMRDATIEASQLSDDEKQKLLALSPQEGGGASRLQILQHIYTRCQEEVEKMVDPGVALLNKLLRTEISSIRANQLNYYLCPQSDTITTPDGKTLELKGQGKVLIPPMQLVDAISTAVKKVRTIENAGGTSRVAAAGFVESCRQLAIEARSAIVDSYGVDSATVKEFEKGLQVVFRPDTANSVYIQGE